MRKLKDSPIINHKIFGYSAGMEHPTLKTDPSKPVLLVEDEPDDAFLVQAAFEAAGIKSPLYLVSDGCRASDYLAGRGEFTDRTLCPFPRLVLLDLKLPMMSGFEVLSWIRSHYSMSSLIVIILSSSDRDGDIEEAYRRGANAYLVKPSGMAALVDMCKAINAFWLQQNRELKIKLWELASFPGTQNGDPQRPAH